MTKDKPEPIISASGNKLSRDPVLARAGKLAERQEFYRDCLLYTSDAADE